MDGVETEWTESQAAAFSSSSRSLMRRRACQAIRFTGLEPGASPISTRAWRGATCKGGVRDAQLGGPDP